MKKTVFFASAAFAAVTASAEAGCIVSGSTNSVPASVAYSAGASVAGVVPAHSAEKDVEGRFFTWQASEAIDVISEKFGSVLSIR
jgi:hypothetical protein